jgi:tRNA A37 methylthiotransferase MiaB
MTGFPGETSEQFQDTLRLADELVVDYTEVYGFSSRVNTAAASKMNQVPLPIVHRRRNQLWRRALFANTERRLKKLLTVRL